MNKRLITSGSLLLFEAMLAGDKDNFKPDQSGIRISEAYASFMKNVQAFAVDYVTRKIREL